MYRRQENARGVGLHHGKEWSRPERRGNRDLRKVRLKFWIKHRTDRADFKKKRRVRGLTLELQEGEPRIRGYLVCRWETGIW